MRSILSALLTLSSLLSTSHALAHPSRRSSWATLAPIPIARMEHSTVFLPPSTIAVLGGIVPSTPTDVNPVLTTPLMQFYSIATNTWTTSTPIPRALNHLNAAVVNGKIYVLGGLADLGELEWAWRGVPDSFVYDPSSDTWEQLQDLPAGTESRGSAAMGVHGTKIVLSGGMTDLELSGDRTQISVSVVSIFDTVNRVWMDLPDEAKQMPGGRDHAGSAVVDGKMYVLGGRDSGQENVKDTVFVLDLDDLESGWTVSEAKMPTARAGVATGVVDGKVYVLGGEGNTAVESGVFDQVEVYDTGMDQWESAGTMEIPRHGGSAVGVGGKIYVPGGGLVQSGGWVADFDVFTP